MSTYLKILCLHYDTRCALHYQVKKVYPFLHLYYRIVIRKEFVQEDILIAFA